MTPLVGGKVVPPTTRPAPVCCGPGWALIASRIAAACSYRSSSMASFSCSLSVTVLH